MGTTYEWAAEQTDEHGDILDVVHFPTLADAASFRFEDYETVICLIRDVGDDTTGLTDRCWAYLEDGKLPSQFEYADGAQDGPPVPKRFHAEVAKTAA